MRTALVTMILGVCAAIVPASVTVGVAHAAPRGQNPKAPRAPAPDKPPSKAPAQKQADRHFKSGVALFKEAKYAEALAEFERAYEIAPHPLVLYNIAGCHRELSHYGEAVTYYSRFLSDGKGKVPTARLAAAQAELDGILARIARVTVTIAPPIDGVTLSLDGAVLDQPVMPLIVPPGDHRLVAHAGGRRDAERTLRVASGDEISVELTLAELPVPVVPRETLSSAGITDLRDVLGPDLPHPVVRRRFVVAAGFGTNLRRAGAADNGAPEIGLGVAVGTRLELGAELVLVAYAAVPSVSVRVAGDKLSLHLVGALPIAFTDGPMTQTFVAGGVGLGVRYRMGSGLALRLESYASFAGKAHGTTIPTFLRGELWF